jgi:hypothetical protein
MKKILIIALFALFAKVNSFSQLNIQTQIQFVGLTIEFQGEYDSTLAVKAQDVLENFNPDKISFSSYNHTQEKFFIKCNSSLNKVELLSIFRDAGMEPYYIENNLKYSLNSTATNLITSNTSVQNIE